MARRKTAALAVLMVSLTLGACGGSGAGASAGAGGAHADDGPPRVSLDTAEAKKTLGEDDGFHAAIFYGAELGGTIDDCGCPGHPQGGLPWRLGYTEGFRAKYSDVGFLQVDAGNSMSDTINASGKLFPESAVKNEWVLKAFERFNFDAVNISHGDVYFLAQFLQSGVHEKALADHPMLARFVSANLEPARPEMVAPPPFVVRELGGGRLSSGPVRVAFIGLTESHSILPTHTGFRVVDAATSLTKVLPRAREQSDLVVVLAYMAPDGARTLASRFEGQVDAFIVAHPRARDAEPILDTQPRMAFARYQTRQLGELRLHMDGKKILSVTNRYVALDEQLPKDPIAEQMAADAKAAIKKAQLERFQNPLPAPVDPVLQVTPPEPAPGGGE